MKLSLKYKKVRNGYIVYNEILGTHTHIGKEKTCRKLIYWLNNDILPYSIRLQESAKRLLSSDEFEKLREKKKKPYYVNVNGKRGINL